MRKTHWAPQIVLRDDIFEASHTYRLRGLNKYLTVVEAQGGSRRYYKAYLAERDAIAPLGTDVSAGGMPDRVKCLHVAVAHALAAGPGVNPFGDEALDELGDWWAAGPCVTTEG